MLKYAILLWLSKEYEIYWDEISKIQGKSLIVLSVLEKFL